MTTTLPVFKGWTVDVRLKHFRKIKKESEHFAGMVYLPFDSEQGDGLLSQYIKGLSVNSPEFKTVLETI